MENITNKSENELPNESQILPEDELKKTYSAPSQEELDKMLEEMKEFNSLFPKRDVSNALDQAWRNNPPIVIRNGRRIDGYRPSLDDYQELGNSFAKFVKNMIRLSKGLSSEGQKEDVDYTSLCERVVEGTIKEETSRIIKDHAENMTIKIEKMHSAVKTPLPNTNPARLKTDTIVDEIIRIDLDESLTFSEKQQLKEPLMKPTEDSKPLPECNSKDAGMIIPELTKKKMEEALKQNIDKAKKNKNKKNKKMSNSVKK